MPGPSTWPRPPLPAARLPGAAQRPGGAPDAAPAAPPLRCGPQRGPRVPLARAVPFPHATFKFRLISFKSSLHYVLRRATIYFKFRFISVLRHALRRSTIHFYFRLFNVLHREFRRATIYSKFSLSGVCRCAIRRATLYIIFIFNSSVSWRASSRDDSYNFILD